MMWMLLRLSTRWPNLYRNLRYSTTIRIPHAQFFRSFFLHHSTSRLFAYMKRCCFWGHSSIKWIKMCWPWGWVKCFSPKTIFLFARNIGHRTAEKMFSNSPTMFFCFLFFWSCTGFSFLCTEILVKKCGHLMAMMIHHAVKLVLYFVGLVEIVDKRSEKKRRKTNWLQTH